MSSRVLVLLVEVLTCVPPLVLPSGLYHPKVEFHPPSPRPTRRGCPVSLSSTRGLSRRSRVSNKFRSPPSPWGTDVFPLTLFDCWWPTSISYFDRRPDSSTLLSLCEIVYRLLDLETTKSQTYQVYDDPSHSRFTKIFWSRTSNDVSVIRLFPFGFSFSFRFGLVFGRWLLCGHLVLRFYVWLQFPILFVSWLRY